MSTDPRYETSTEPATETPPTAPADGPRTVGEGLPARDGANSGAIDSAAGAGAAATFDTHCTRRLPNTVDRENEHVG